MRKSIAISACFLFNTRYDGKKVENKRVLNFLNELKENNIHIQFICPEQLGGLTTPRMPCEIVNNRVINKEGKDNTLNFKLGAESSLEILKFLNINIALLKQRSPSCGCGKIYDGTFSGNIKSGDGITTSLFKENGIEVFTEEDLDSGDFLKKYFSL